MKTLSFKNLSINMKLILGFAIVLLMLLLSMGVSLISIQNMRTQINAYEHETVPDIDSTWSMRKSMASVQRYLLRMLIAEDSGTFENELTQAVQEAKIVHEKLQVYANNQRDSRNDSIISETDIKLKQAASIREQYTALLQESSQENLIKATALYVSEYAPLLDEVEAILLQLGNDAEERSHEQEKNGTAAANFAWIMLLTVGGASLVLTLIVLMAIRKSILTPVKEIEGVYEEMSKGNMQAQISYESQDELGRMARSIRKTNAMLASYINDISQHLGLMSRGDMRINVNLDYVGDFSAIKQAIQNTATSLNETLLTINTASEQVSTGSAQVASGAQALASGSTEQASSIEQLSASAVKIAMQAAENSDNVRIATQYVGQAGEGVLAGNEHMKQLTDAMANINASSSQIANITKVIEDIAFQTNILALNAAIEAARAGSAGKGFAVVADEVRNLAAKSAEAAKQTAELIHHSSTTVADGLHIAEKTAEILISVQEKAKMAEESIQKIDAASAGQAAAIEQIKQGLNQISTVVQTNAATAEENSATSEEMSAQAAALQEEVNKFILTTSDPVTSPFSISLMHQPSSVKNASRQSSLSFGKY